ncbi:tRNA pseudouridine(55) synthase TruB [soil metagenome]
MHGVVNLDKPVGPTSHDMVGLLRRLTGIRRIGHAGTLDPLASGVLPILVGAATRFSEELTGGSKRYDATIRLGARSATDDSEGPIEPVDAPLPAESDVSRVLATMTGTFLQRPPAFSARKLGGRTAYRAARAGEKLELPPREVTIHSLELRGSEGTDGVLDVRVHVSCGTGTYIRSIARDLGERLGTGGYLLALRRTEAAGLTIYTAVEPVRLEELASAGRLAEALLPVGRLLPLPRVVLDQAATWRFIHGSAQPFRDGPGDGRVAVFEDERLLGVGVIAGGVLSPDKVIPSDALVS